MTVTKADLAKKIADCMSLGEPGLCSAWDPRENAPQIKSELP